ncbi:hypothetical protein [Actinotalea sp. Marseille-Q4924]|uniref:hypothetical protein n=1 Tax=Actinotalea sp. Marseille-Q4924 TaxID=2866571 RepID=UPI001CE491AD|nr:hypothetical protein [Actinotalea sp. Marseille-Q4924]
MSTSSRTIRATVTAAAVAVAVLSGCGQEPPAPGEDVTVADVAGAEFNAGDGESGWDERVVTVRGQVLRILDPGVFLIGDPGAFEPSVLVMSPSTDFSDLGLDVTDVLIAEDTVVEVTGAVRRLSLGEFQEDYAIPYDEDVFEEYAGDPVIVADRLTAVTGD